MASHQEMAESQNESGSTGLAALITGSRASSFHHSPPPPPFSLLVNVETCNRAWYSRNRIPACTLRSGQGVCAAQENNWNKRSPNDGRRSRKSDKITKPEGKKEENHGIRPSQTKGVFNQYSMLRGDSSFGSNLRIVIEGGAMRGKPNISGSRESILISLAFPLVKHIFGLSFFESVYNSSLLPITYSYTDSSAQESLC